MYQHPRPSSPPRIFQPPGGQSKPLDPEYTPVQNGVNPDTNRNYEGDPTYGPQFVGLLGSFDNGVVQYDLEDATTMWYTMYPEVIGGC